MTVCPAPNPIGTRTSSLSLSLASHALALALMAASPPRHVHQQQREEGYSVFPTNSDMRPSPFGNASIHDNANHDKQANFNTQQRGYSDIRSQKRGFARRLLELHVPPTTTTSSTAQDTGHRRVRCSNGATPAAAHGETQSVPPGYRPVQTWLVSSVNFGAIRSHQPDSHERRRDAIQSQLSGLYIAACAMCRGLLQTGLDNVRPARSLRVLLFASIASYCPTHTIDNVTDGTTPGGGGQGEISRTTQNAASLHAAHSAIYLVLYINIMSQPIIANDSGPQSLPRACGLPGSAQSCGSGSSCLHEILFAWHCLRFRERHPEGVGSMLATVADAPAHWDPNDS